MSTCIYRITYQDGYYTDWKTACGHSLRMEAPMQIGFSFAPLPTDNGAKFCRWCGSQVDITKETRR